MEARRAHRGDPPCFAAKRDSEPICPVPGRVAQTVGKQGDPPEKHSRMTGNTEVILSGPMGLEVLVEGVRENFWWYRSSSLGGLPKI